MATQLETLIQKVTSIITRLNDWEDNAKKISELPEQTTIDLSSKIHVQRGTDSEFLTVEKILQAADTIIEEKEIVLDTDFAIGIDTLDNNKKKKFTWLNIWTNYIKTKVGDYVQPKILDGFAGVTSGFAIGQLTYNLPAGSKCIDVYLSHTLQYKTTPNNASLANRWSQSGDVVTITKSPVLNNYIYIKYY